MLLATFKHISSKNADYYAAEAYLTFEHDEFTMKPTLDENGRFIPRKDYRISTLNCRDEDFAIACLRANLRYGKNQKREDVKSHHYIISFDPKDVPDHGLTVDLAQSLGEKFCKEHFPGHQAIVCTHPDGHNGSGNVHVHIVINSLRIEEVPFMPYMDRSCDTRPGMKHRCTNAAMEYFRSEVMEMCHDAGLYQIDLLNGSKTRVTEREYWAKKKGQLALDEENAVLAEQGLPVKQTKFETDKDKLREEIRMALSDAVSFEDFAEKLLRRGITVKESRGRLSYLTPDRTKPITARKLGDDFDKAAVFAIFVRNTKRVRAKTDTIHSAPAMQKIINERDTVSRMVDIDAAKEKGKGYEPAEKDPIGFHGVPKFDPTSGQLPKSNAKPTYSKIFGDWLCEMAEQDDKLVGITPAMREGSGMVEFSERFPQQYFDVAIAEQHAVTFAAGLAIGGYKPVVAIYSTFLQRAYDQLIHDVAIQNLPVLFAIDRAGIVGADGQTHQGAFDLSFMRCIPNIIIMTPSDENECRQMLYTGYKCGKPAAVRYPRGNAIGVELTPLAELEIGRSKMVRQGEKIAILNFGTLLPAALSVAEKLNATVVDMRFVKPIDEARILEVANTHDVIVTLEENAIQGGAGSAVSEVLNSHGKTTALLQLGLPDIFIPQGTQQEALAEIKLDEKGIEEQIIAFIKG